LKLNGGKFTQKRLTMQVMTDDRRPATADRRRLVRRRSTVIGRRSSVVGRSGCLTLKNRS